MGSILWDNHGLQSETTTRWGYLARQYDENSYFSYAVDIVAFIEIKKSGLKLLAVSQSEGLRPSVRHLMMYVFSSFVRYCVALLKRYIELTSVCTPDDVTSLFPKICFACRYERGAD